MIGLDETIKSPSDGHQFPLEQGLSEKTKEALIAETRRQQDDLVKSRVEDIRKDTERRFSQRMEEAEKDHQRQLAEQRKAVEAANAEKRQAVEAARTKALAEGEEDRKDLLARFDALNQQLKEKGQEEVKLHTEIHKLQLSADAAKLEAAKEAQAEIAKARAEIANQEAEKQKLRLAGVEKQLDDARKANETLQRKLEQSSQQLQGEVQELAIEEDLKDAFPTDKVVPVKTGQRGADILQRVRSPKGADCGAILWESKNTQNWSNDWIKRLAENQVAAEADLAVLVTSAFPAGVEEPFFQEGALWVVKPSFAPIAAHILRQVLLEGARHRAIQWGREQKAEQLYDFLSSRQFALYLRNLMQSCSTLGVSLQQEQRAMNKAWKQRQREIDLMVRNASSMVGDIMAIGGSSLKELDSLDDFLLPGGDEDDEKPSSEAAA